MPKHKSQDKDMHPHCWAEKLKTMKTAKIQKKPIEAALKIACLQE